MPDLKYALKGAGFTLLCMFAGIGFAHTFFSVLPLVVHEICLEQNRWKMS